MSVDPIRDDIIGFLGVRLSEDETSDAMNLRPEEDILGKIPVSISEIWGAARAQRTQSHLAGTDNTPKLRKIRRHGRWVGIGGCLRCDKKKIKAPGGYKSRQGMGALMWIIYEERLQSLDEVC